MRRPSPPTDPRDVATRETLAFVTRRFRKPASLLEVGCGSGRLAAALEGLGHAVTAIDAHPDAVRAARANGVTAVRADILEYEDEPFDGVLFTRSLHHVHPLGRALDRARELTRPGGWLILEEFAHTRIDRTTARWFYDGLELLVAAGRLELPDRWHTPHRDPRERWKRWHTFDPPLHSDAAMQRAVASRFEIASTARVPYLYRYATERLERTPAGVKTGAWLHARETEHVDSGVLEPIGWRLEARRPGTSRPRR